MIVLPLESTRTRRASYDIVIELEPDVLSYDNATEPDLNQNPRTLRTYDMITMTVLWHHLEPAVRLLQLYYQNQMDH